MRIVSGLYGGRKLSVPKGRDIRPTSDKVRGAIFNMLRSRGAVEGAHVIDCFCGTGALGLEALSQGASHCIFIDNSKDSIALAKENAAAFKTGNAAEFIFKDAAKLSDRLEKYAAANLVFIDPPYNKDLVPKALQALKKGGWLSQDAVLVIEAEKNFAAAFLSDFTIDQERLYGDTKILLLRYANKPL